MPHEQHTERSSLADLAGLALWRASAIDSDRATPDERSVAVALSASASELASGFECAELEKQLHDASSSLSTIDETVGGAVRLDHEEALSSLVVRRLTLRGLLREQEHR